MDKHIEECICYVESCCPWMGDCTCQCICDILRTCENRVWKIAYAQGLGAGSDEHGQHEVGFVKGYAAGLDAAREAVLGAKAVDIAYGRGLDEPAQFIWMNNALAAIDALKED